MRAIPFVLFVALGPEFVAGLPLPAGARFALWATVSLALFFWGVADLRKRFDYM